ncbi:MAG: type II secretion system F family protein [Geminicoccaceae bacterium]
MRTIILRRQKLSQKSQYLKLTSSSWREIILTSVAHRLRILQTSQISNVASRLEPAGFRTRNAVIIYLLIKFVAPVFTMLLGITLLYTITSHISSLGFVIIISVIFISFFAPNLFISNTIARRQQKIQQSLPDSLDLLVICAEAGLTLDAALHRVVNELADSAPEIADELAVTSVELSFLPERRIALQNLARRVNLPTVRGVVATLIQAERYGTPLAHSLRVLSAEFREQRMLRAEEKAGRLPAILTIPMIIFILPALFVILIGPALIDVLNHANN